MTSLSHEGGGGAIGGLFHLLDLLINVIITTICGPIQMLTVDVYSKYVLRRTILESYLQLKC
jgi:hypothetical protein